MLIYKEFTFDAAHKLLNYNGKCANLHGHTYTLQVVISGEVKENGLVMDFGEIKEQVKKHVLDVLDHHYINDIIEQPSAENISIWIWNKLHKTLPLFEVRLWESPTNCAIYQGK